MQCPKCEDGIISKIQFKDNKKLAYLCDSCDTVWFEDEKIDMTTGHPLKSSISEEHSVEDAFVYLDEEDEE